MLSFENLPDDDLKLDPSLTDDLEMNEKEIVIPDLFIGSRAVLRRAGIVTAGTMRYMEGDLMEVELTEWTSFGLGETVDVTVCTPSQNYVWRTTVIGKVTGVIAIMFPYHKFTVIDEKRSAPRISIQCNGLLSMPEELVKAEPLSRAEILKDTWADELEYSLLDEGLLRRLVELMEEDELQVMEEQAILKREAGRSIAVTIRDLSLYGISFIVADGPELSCGQTLFLELELSFPCRCTVEITRAEHASAESIYGGILKEMDENTIRSMRAYILSEQLKIYYRKNR